MTNQRRDNETVISGSGNGDERKGTHKEVVALVGLCKGHMRGEGKAEVKNDSQVSGSSNWVDGVLHWRGGYRRKSTPGRGGK